MEPFEYLRLLRRRWRVVAACVVVAIAAAWLTTPDEPTADSVVYEATAVVVRDAQSGTTPQALGTVGLFVRSGAVPRRVAQRIDFDGNPVLLARRVETEADEAIGTLAVTASANSAEDAAALANAFVEETLSHLAEEAQSAQAVALDALATDIAELESEIDDLDAQIDAAGGPEAREAALLLQRRDGALSRYGSALDQQQQLLDAPPPTSGYIVLEPALAELAVTPSGGFQAPTSKPVRVALGAGLGLLLGLGVILVIERLDPRLTTRGAVERAFGLPVVADVPYVSGMRRNPYELRAVTRPSSVVAEAYRNLRAAIVLMPTVELGADGQTRRHGIGSLFRRGQQTAASVDPAVAPSVVLVTSATPGVGKTTTVANLAAMFAEAGRSVLVLGFDFRRPEIHNHFGVEPGPGLSEVFSGKATLDEVIRGSSLDGVSIVTDGLGVDSHGDIANTGRKVVDDARRHADVVLIDSAPILATADAVELTPAVDTVVLVARAGATTREDAQRCVEVLSRLSANATGVVLIGAPETSKSYGYYYAYEPDEQPSRRKRRRSRHGEDAEVDKVDAAAS